MNIFKFILAIGLFFLSLGLSAKETPKYVIQKDYRNKLPPMVALEKLKEGNQRYLSRKTRQHDYLAQSLFSAQHGQFPFAFILNCMDSRSIPRIVFDQGVGSLFTASVAGNVVDTDMLASMEYAVYTGVKVIVVMGHTQCGAVEAACLNSGFGNIDALIRKIRPAVERLQRISGGKINCEDQTNITRIVLGNVYDMINFIKKHSPYLEKKIKNRDIIIVGALHHLKTGEVDFYPDPMNILKLSS